MFEELHRVFPLAVITADSDSIGFGTGPPDPAGLLAGAGKVHRHVKIHTEEDLRRPELGELFTAALERFAGRDSSGH